MSASTVLRVENAGDNTAFEEGISLHVDGGDGSDRHFDRAAGKAPMELEMGEMCGAAA